ncbi:MAG: 2-isopropylmalate synthase [Planctomycetes bacterium]|nr:2-isopropylmalate synthase [Planctomycetota bacterium]
MSAHKAAKDRVIVFDTTLRDGEQSPGASLTNKEKMEVAKALVSLGVDVIEAGFPIASNDDFEAVKAIGQEVPVKVAGLARCMEKDIARAGEALRKANDPRIHVFLATSAIHRQYKLKKAKDEIVRLSVEGVRQALEYVEDVEFSPEDASRTEPDFLAEVVEAVIEAGASTVNIPDTVGYAMPSEYGALIAYLYANVPNIDRAVISVHCHNDLGLAVANSISAVQNGARQVEVSLNGIGERAGNCSLEEFVMGLKIRKDILGLTTGVNTKRIYPACRLAASLMNLKLQRNKAIVGDNAFAHEAGIHQDGVLKERRTYEIMDPREVGIKESRMVIGKHSGKHAVKKKITELGYSLSDDEVTAITQKVKDLADRKKTIYDADIEALITETVDQDAPPTYSLGSFHVTSGKGLTPTSTVTLMRGGEEIRDAAIGDGPIDAAYNAIDRITGINAKLESYHLDAVTEGREALGQVTVNVKFGKATIQGRGVSTDIVEASVLAYLAAVNRYAALNRAHAKEGARGKKR